MVKATLLNVEHRTPEETEAAKKQRRVLCLAFGDFDERVTPVEVQFDFSSEIESGEVYAAARAAVELSGRRVSFVLDVEGGQVAELLRNITAIRDKHSEYNWD